MGQKKKEHTGRFKLFLHRGINNVHKFLCTCNAVCLRITCMVVTVCAICETCIKSLLLVKLDPFSLQW